MRITRVQIENFQSHKKTDIWFDKGFNILVGSSNSGKSGVLRSIKWCLTNTPSGNSFIKKGESAAKVRVTLDNGYAIERERGRSAGNNYYRLLNDEGDLIEEYTGFGSKVPQEIEAIVGTIEEIDYTFADQMESPYLIADTPRVRAEKIGSLEDFATLDLAISDIKADERDVKKEEREGQKRIGELEKEMNELKKEVSRVEPLYEYVKSVRSSVLQKEKDARELRLITERMSEINESLPSLIDSQRFALEVTTLYDEIDIEGRVEKYKRLKQSLDELRETKEKLKELSSHSYDYVDKASESVKRVEEEVNAFRDAKRLLESLQSNEERMSRIEPISDAINEIDLAPIEERILKVRELAVLRDGLYENEQKRLQLKGQFSIIEQDISQLLNEFVDEIQRTEVCPTCAQDTTGVDIDLITSNL